MRLKTWAIEVRAPFLALPLILSILGTSLSVFQGVPFHLLNFLIFTAVLLLLHITVNTLNEYYDHMLGIDFHTQRTMFNGGTGLLQEGAIQPRQTFMVAIACFLIALLLSVYLLIDIGLMLLPIFLVGMVFALFYTQIFARNMMGELSAGLGLGFLPVLGAFMVQAQYLDTSVLLLATMSGFLTFNLLLLNQFPDQKADRQGGRKNLILFLGEKRSAILYSTLTFASYGVLLAAVLVGLLPWPVLIGALTLPLAYQACLAAFNYGVSPDNFIKGQGANVKMILFTQLLAATGLMVSILHGSLI